MATEHTNLLRRLRRQGFMITMTRGSGHLKVRRPGGRFVIIPSSPSDSYRGMKNSVRDLRRIGFDPRA